MQPDMEDGGGLDDDGSGQTVGRSPTDDDKQLLFSGLDEAQKMPNASSKIHNAAH
jgi:hypothetical protein